MQLLFQLDDEYSIMHCFLMLLENRQKNIYTSKSETDPKKGTAVPGISQLFGLSAPFLKKISRYSGNGDLSS